jgi:hypothetical protein
MCWPTSTLFTTLGRSFGSPATTRRAAACRRAAGRRRVTPHLVALLPAQSIRRLPTLRDGRNGHGSARPAWEFLQRQLLVDDGDLQAPPDPISTISLLPDTLQQAWQNGRTTALSIAAALSQRAGRTLPWSTIRAALDGAFRTRLIERAEGVGVWPCDYAGAGAVSIQLSSEKQSGGTGTAVAGPGASRPDTRVSPELILKANQLQDLNDVLPELLRVAAGHDLTCKVSVALKGSQRPKDDVVLAINALLKPVGEGFEII